MLSPRSGKILKYIVGEYIDRAAPVPSQDIADNADLGVSPATIRNEMAFLEREGFLIRPHTSAGCIPSDAGYRFYVRDIQDAALPWEERRRISHTFHQVEKEVEAWVSLTATLLAQSAQNVAVVSLPKSNDCKLKHFELVAVHDDRALAVVVLDGARVRQKLVSFDRDVSQADLFVVSGKLNAACDGLTAGQIATKEMTLEPLEKQAADHLVDIMKSEDSREYREPYLEGWHFMLNQPEFAQSGQMRTLMELVESRELLRVIAPTALDEPGVHVIIGKENRDEAIRNCSVVVSQYGLSDEATGTIAVVGPTRMPYRRTIPTVYYLSAVLSQLVAGLYGHDIRTDRESD
jgi:heat-inducible transcriptional repressor